MGNAGERLKQLADYGDQRQYAWCVHCGGDTSTRDHVPSRVFLDQPYPDNLPVVPACRGCNTAMSLDEEYVACMVECALAGSLAKVRRAKIRKILDRKSALAARLECSRRIVDGGTLFLAEKERVASVMVKLARGHVLYELNERCSEEPTHVQFQPIHLMSNETREWFEKSPDTSLRPGLAIWPEVGSRALQRVVASGPDYDNGWVIVQPGTYRYLASPGTLIRIVIREYLACEVVWAE